MKIKLLAIAAILAVSACSNAPNYNEAQYWQRTNVSETVYMNGPKAQQILNRDIARCVTELRELERLGMLKDAIPTDYHGRVMDPDKLEILDHDSPERDDHLFAEHTDYQNFSGCMESKGWHRIKAVPFDVSARAIKTHKEVRGIN